MKFGLVHRIMTDALATLGLLSLLTGGELDFRMSIVTAVGRSGASGSSLGSLAATPHAATSLLLRSRPMVCRSSTFSMDKPLRPARRSPPRRVARMVAPQSVEPQWTEARTSLSRLALLDSRACEFDSLSRRPGAVCAT